MSPNYQNHMANSNTTIISTKSFEEVVTRRHCTELISHVYRGQLQNRTEYSFHCT